MCAYAISVKAENKIAALLPINNICEIGGLLFINPLLQRGEQFGIGNIGMTAMEGRVRIIFQTELDRFGQTLSGNVGNDGQSEIDARCHPARSDEIAVLDHALLFMRRAKFLEQRGVSPMGRRAFAVQQSCHAEGHRAGANRRHILRRGGLIAQKLQRGMILNHIPDAKSTGDAQQIGLRTVGETGRGQNGKTAVCLNRPDCFGRRVNLGTRNPGQYLRGAGEIQLGDPVEQQEYDVEGFWAIGQGAAPRLEKCPGDRLQNTSAPRWCPILFSPVTDRAKHSRICLGEQTGIVPASQYSWTCRYGISVYYVTEKSWLDRAKSLTGVIVIHAALGYALVNGMGIDMAKTVTAGFKVINVTPPLPPEPVPDQKPAKAEEGAASPENLSAEQTQIVAPKPEIKLNIESPVVAAPVAGAGNDNDAGASDRLGPGFGSGGQGDGSGSGNSGDGAGSGGIVSGPRHLSGSISRRDIPRSVWNAGKRGNVVAHFTVGVDGRASDCRILQSSGHPSLDATTCRLIEERFRFEPARDRRGRAVARPYGWLQEWWQDGRGPQQAD